MTKRALRVAMIGSAFMGRAHSQAWRTAPHFFDLPLEPELALLVGRDAETTAERAGTLGGGAGRRTGARRSRTQRST